MSHPAIDRGPAFDLLWHLAIERQRIFWQRVVDAPPPWTDDKIIRDNRFCNAYRASDRTSQHLIRVIYDPSLPQTLEERFFRVLLYDAFKRMETWNLLREGLGAHGTTWRAWDGKAVRASLQGAWDRGDKLFTAAYVITGAKCIKHGINLTSASKMENMVRMVEGMMQQEAWKDVYSTDNTEHAFDRLCQWPLMGRFSGMQVLTDLGYTPDAQWDEDAWVEPGPGALRGLKRVFPHANRYHPLELIRYLRDLQHEYLIEGEGGWLPIPGRALSMMDIQNLLCETDKYCRQALPFDASVSKRTKIKQGFDQTDPLLEAVPMPWYPPKWNVNEAVVRVYETLAPLVAVKQVTGQFVTHIEFDV